MTLASEPLGRRERNKREKLDRIIAAASELFAEHGVEEVTTQQIADQADIGTGTLFLYAKTKGELFLMVQNTHYAEALERGRSAAERVDDTLEAVMAIMQPIVECNRTQIANGRTYLREMVFGDPEEPHHTKALMIAEHTEEALAAVLARDGSIGEAQASTLARIISAIGFLSMASNASEAVSNAAVVADIRTQVSALLAR